MITGDIYKALITKIKSVQTASVSVIKHVALYSGQLEEPEAHDPFPFPAWFILFQPGTPKTIGQGRQQYNMSIDMLVATEVIVKGTSRDSETKQDRSLEHLNMIERVHAVLQNFNGQMLTPQLNFSSLNRTGFDHFEGNEKTENGYLIIHRLTYQTRMVIDSALANYVDTATPPLNITNVVEP